MAKWTINAKDKTNNEIIEFEVYASNIVSKLIYKGNTYYPEPLNDRRISNRNARQFSMEFGEVGVFPVGTFTKPSVAIKGDRYKVKVCSSKIRKYFMIALVALLIINFIILLIL